MPVVGRGPFLAAGVHRDTSVIPERGYPLSALCPKFWSSSEGPSPAALEMGLPEVTHGDPPPVHSPLGNTSSGIIGDQVLGFGWGGVGAALDRHPGGHLTPRQVQSQSILSAKESEQGTKGPELAWVPTAGLLTALFSWAPEEQLGSELKPAPPPLSHPILQGIGGRGVARRLRTPAST